VIRTAAAMTFMLASLTGLTGCGTLVSLGDDAQPFGGVILESKIIAQGVPRGLGAFTGDIDVPSLWPLALIDMPFSLFGDTLALPITLQRSAHSPLADPVK
jgi:uncharacterized protein YceK